MEPTEIKQETPVQENERIATPQQPPRVTPPYQQPKSQPIGLKILWLMIFCLVFLIPWVVIYSVIDDLHLNTMDFSYSSNHFVLGWAIVLVAATYATMLIVEHRFKTPLHWLQYLLTGAAVILFHLLLASFDEHLPFGLSYLISSVMTVGLITMYMSGSFRNRKPACIVGLVLAALYALVYVLINVNSVPLLLVSLVLFVGLAVTMFFTRKINKKAENE